MAQKYLVSAELIVYLKLLIYVSAFKDHCNVDHLIFYNKEVAFLSLARLASQQLAMERDPLHRARCPVR